MLGRVPRMRSFLLNLVRQYKIPSHHLFICPLQSLYLRYADSKSILKMGASPFARKGESMTLENISCRRFITHHIEPCLALLTSCEIMEMIFRLMVDKNVEDRLKHYKHNLFCNLVRVIYILFMICD